MSRRSLEEKKEKQHKKQNDSELWGKIKICQDPSLGWEATPRTTDACWDPCSGAAPHWPDLGKGLCGHSWHHSGDHRQHTHTPKLGDISEVWQASAGLCME